ncbi:PhzF family phenazine biosynthesis protein [Lysobacter sp. GX 14042]|uniref:PhzF family phenazine biosynthesis protein n=1 Tax=Lysobacter sp. GX 14042 TaxID=2907155 RepID=UPI001F261A36|nr:PhzF family phenazine biosynthesis protein [Lysobacter sp. GX 14042]MCE7031822.1 PhzF family phenazine biosynthesis protein [Lysobacter sp. GX 14042]
MSLRRYLQLDVFADRPGAGNPLAVVLDCDGLGDAAMQAIARWNNRPETTFVFPPTRPGAGYRVRMFSPAQEVPFAGHPSVGTAHAVLDAGMAGVVDGHVWQEGLAGVLPLAVTGDGADRAIAVRAPSARVVAVGERGAPTLAAPLRPFAPGRLPPALMDGGRRWWVAEVADEDALRRAEPDWEAIAHLAEGTGSMGLCAFARADPGQDYDLVVRALVGAGKRFEDAASGAANATLAAWLQHNRAVPGRDGAYTVSQGREVGFDARLQLRIDADGEVWSGGKVCPVVRGHIDW